MCTPCCLLLFQYFIGVTLIALIPDIPEIVTGIQFSLQNNISLRFVLDLCMQFAQIHSFRLCHGICLFCLPHKCCSLVIISILLFRSIEVGSSIAVQVCLLQIPILILANIIYVSTLTTSFLPHGFAGIFTVIPVSFCKSRGGFRGPPIWSTLRKPRLGTPNTNVTGHNDCTTDHFQTTGYKTFSEIT